MAIEMQWQLTKYHFDIGLAKLSKFDKASGASFMQFNE
jgi:hypothetical protein